MFTIHQLAYFLIIDLEKNLQKYKSKLLIITGALNNVIVAKDVHDTSIGIFFDNRFRKEFTKIQIKIIDYNR